MILLLIFSITGWPVYDYDISTNQVTIGGCINEDNCTINQTGYRTSGPYSKYNKIKIDFGPNIITGDAFQNSLLLEYIDISATINKIEPGFLQNCGNIKGIHVTNQSLFFRNDKYGSLYTFDSKALVKAPNIPNVELLEDTEEILLQAFQTCKLEFLFIPPKVKTIHQHAFVDSSIEKVMFSDNSIIQKIDEFSSTYIKRIDLPISAVSLSYASFYDSADLIEVGIPGNSNLTTIGSSAFSGCSSLQKFIIPNKATKLSASSFKNCISLTTVYIPASVEIIDSTSFSGCNKLSNITVNTNNSHFILENGVLFDYERTQAIVIPMSITTFSVPLKLTSIGQTALQACPNLIRLIVEENHTEYEENEQMLINKRTHTVIAFLGGLESFDIPPTVEKLGESCGIGLTKIQSLLVPEGVDTIGSTCFKGSSLKSIRLPSTTKVISSEAFAQCSQLTDVFFPPNGTISIGGSSFVDCPSLKELIFSCNISSVAYQSFVRCGASKIVFKGNYLQSTYSNAFARMGNLRTVELPPSLTVIDYQTFAHDSQLESVSFPRGNNVKQVSGKAFQDCISLKSFSFSSSLQNILENAFVGCKSIESLDFPTDCNISGLSEASIFEGCESILNITLPGSITDIEPSVFYKCIKLDVIKFNNGSVLKSENGLIYDSDNVVVLCPPGRINATVKSSAVRIGERCFYGCSKLTSISFEDDPSVLKEIGASTFLECSSLTDILFPASVESISVSAFSGCTKLSIVNFGKNSELMKLESGIFTGCYELTEVDLSNCHKLILIGDNCFKDCSLLEQMFIPNKVQTIGANAFSGCSSLWKVEIEKNSSLTELSSSCFNGCENLRSVNLPRKLEVIGANCFVNCGLFDTFVIPPSVTNVGEGALLNCPLRHVIYCGMNELPSNAFGNQRPIVHVRISYPFNELLGSPADRSLDGNCEIRSNKYQFAPSAIEIIAACAVDLEGE